MFIGHDAVGLAAKRFAPRTSLGWLIAAPLLPDLLWPIFLFLGIEHVSIEPGFMKMSPLHFVDYPWSHSLVMTLAWGIAFGGGYLMFTRYMRGAVAIFIGVVSHWVFDWLVHRPDLQFFPGSVWHTGLGLWNHPFIEVPLETALFAVGILMYRDSTHPVDKIGSGVLWAFILFLGIAFIASAAGTPPPSVRALAYGTLLLWLLPFWAAWFDRHRIPEE